MRRYSPLPWTLFHLIILILTPIASNCHQGASESKAHSGNGQQPTQASFSTSGPNEIATEKLLLKPLKDGKIAAHFEFDYLDAEAVPRDPRTLGQRDIAQHFDSFPLSLGQILREYAVAEMHLTLNSGRWQYDAWGYPQSPAVASGAELWVWMADGGEKSVDERWSGLSNALAGLFCASLSAFPTSRTTSPRYAFRPEGQLPLYSFDQPSPSGLNKTQDGLDYVVRHAILPSENICTENLTPFIKLLPCKSYAGIAELLNPHKLFGGWWYGVGVHATWNGDMTHTGQSVNQAGVHLQLTVGAVLDGSAGHQDSKQWSFRSLFDREIQRTCAVTGPGEVRIRQPSGSGGSDSLVLSPSPADRIAHRSSRGQEEDSQEIWDVLFVGEHGLQLTATSHASSNNEVIRLDEMPLSIKRSLRGYDQTRGGFAISITNRLHHSVDAWYVESIPWIIKPYLSSLRVVSVQRLDASQGSSTGVPPQIDPSILGLSHMNYVPPAPGINARTTPALLEIPISLPPRSTVHISLEFEKMFLKYTEHPPDAQRGWDLPGGVLVPTGGLGLPRIYTPPLLADLATPDFSMPYNVIILSGALIALLFGMTFNMLMRRFVIVKL